MSLGERKRVRERKFLKNSIFSKMHKKYHCKIKRQKVFNSGKFNFLHTSP